MSQIEYYKLEQRDLLHPDQTRTVYRLANKGCVDGESFIRAVAHRRSYSEAIINGVLIDVAKELADQLGEGRSVEVPGIGVFSIGVKMKEDKDDDEEVVHNARSLELSHINYRKNRRLFNEVERRLNDNEMRRIYGREGVRIQKSKYPQVKNRMIVAREFLATHPYMTIQDYAEITGLSYSSAQRELKQNWDIPAYGITIHGRGSHRVYVLRQPGEEE